MKTNEMFSMYFCLLFFSLLELGVAIHLFEQIWIPFIQEFFGPSLVEIGPLVQEKLQYQKIRLQLKETCISYRLGQTQVIRRSGANLLVLYMYTGVWFHSMQIMMSWVEYLSEVLLSLKIMKVHHSWIGNGTVYQYQKGTGWKIQWWSTWSENVSIICLISVFICENSCTNMTFLIWQAGPT